MKDYFTKILKLDGWRKDLILKNNKCVYKFAEDKFPYQSVILEKDYRLNNTHVYCSFYKDFKKRNNRFLKINPKTKQKQLCWEKYLSFKGIEYTILLMNNDDLPKINLNCQ